MNELTQLLEGKITPEEYKHIKLAELCAAFRKDYTAGTLTIVPATHTSNTNSTKS